MRTPCGGVGGNVILSASEESSVATRTLRCAQSDTTPPSPDTNHSASEESSVAMRTPCGGVGGNVIPSASEESSVATRTLRCAQSDTTPPSPDTNHSASEESSVATRTLRCAQSDTTPPSPDTNHSASEESSVATRTPCGGVGGNVILSASEESRVATRTLRCAQSDTTPPSPDTNHSASEESRVATRTLRCAQSDTTPPSPDTNHSASEESSVATRTPCGGVGGNVILSASEESRVATRTLRCAQSDTTPPSPNTNHSTSEESRVATRTLRCAQSDTTPPSPDTNHSASEESRVATRTLHCAQSDTTPPSPETNYYAWLVFTSAAAVEFFFARIAELSVQVRLPQVAAVGPATAARLWACAQVSALLPPEATGAALGRALPLAPGDRVLLPRAHSADPAIGRFCESAAQWWTTSPSTPPQRLHHRQPRWQSWRAASICSPSPARRRCRRFSTTFHHSRSAVR
jgi:hypothetical protein